MHSTDPDIKSYNSYRNIVEVALPMALAIMIPQISLLANAIFLGNYSSSDGLVSGQDVLAVAGVAGIYYLIYAMIMFGFSSGMLMILSRQAGQQDLKNLGKYFSNGIILSLMISLGLLLASFLFYKKFFAFSIDHPRIEVLAVDFMRIRIWGLPFLALAHLGNMFFVSTKNTRFMLFGTIGETIVQVLLDYILIYGHFGAPEMGIEGAAWASVFAEITFFLIIYSVIGFLPRFRVYCIRLFSSLDFTYIKQCLKSATPLMIQFFISIGSWEAFFIYIEHLGEAELAASQILRTLYGVTGIFVWALANSTNSIVSNFIGQGKQQEVIPFVRKVIRLSLCYSVLVCILLVLFHKPLFSLYSSNEQILSLAKTALPSVLCGTLFFSVSTIYFNALLGLGKTKLTLLYEFVVILVYLIFITLVIEIYRLPLWVAWTSEFVYWTFILLLCMQYLHRKKWMT